MGSATAGLVFVVAVVVIAVVCLRYSQARVAPMGWQELPCGTLEPTYWGPGLSLLARPSLVHAHVLVLSPTCSLADPLGDKVH